VWNVALVALLVVTWTIIIVVSMNGLESLDAEKFAIAQTCPGFDSWMGAWIWCGWAVVALIFALLQRVLGKDGGTEEETRMTLTV
jgi:hypothetical protein